LLELTGVFHLGLSLSLCLSLLSSFPSLPSQFQKNHCLKVTLKANYHVGKMWHFIWKVTWHSEKSTELIIRSSRFKAGFSFCLAPLQPLLTLNKQGDLVQGRWVSVLHEFAFKKIT
jgi:hypothetical protein